MDWIKIEETKPWKRGEVIIRLKNGAYQIQHVSENKFFNQQWWAKATHWANIEPPKQ